MATPKIFILSEQMRGASFSLSNESYTIGRSDSCDICIADPTISGHHCTLLRQEDGSFVIRDDDSTNGTKVNDQKVEAGQSVQLHNSDIMKLGSVEVLYDAMDGQRIESSRTISVINLTDGGTKTGGIPTEVRASTAGTIALKRSTALRENSTRGKMLNILIVILVVIALIFLAVTLIKNFL